MQTYKEFIAYEDHYADFSKGQWDNWFMAPCRLLRDSDELGQSNWEVQLDRLNAVGTEESDYVILRTSHWACGWIDWLVVRPDSPCVAVCEEIEAKLEDYPVLDDAHFSEKEWESYSDWWAYASTAAELFQLLIKAGKLTEEQAEPLYNAEGVREWFEECIESGDYYGEGCYPRLKYAVDRCGAEEIEKLLALS